MKIVSVKKFSTFVKILSVILIALIVILTTHANAQESNIAVRNLSVYMESCNEAGLIEPVSYNNGAYVAPNGYGYVEDTQLWTISYLSENEDLRDGDYCAIKSSKGINLYLNMAESSIDGSNYIAVNYQSNFYLLPDNYLWKVKKIGDGTFYDIYTLSNKTDETKYLTTINGYVDIITGLGVGREEATRHWLFRDKPEICIMNERAIYDGSDGDDYLKPISFANIYDKIEAYGTNHYFGAYINGNDNNTNVIDSCRNIRTSEIREYEGFNARGLVQIISQSSLCVVDTHGFVGGGGILCTYYETDNNNKKTFFEDWTMTNDYIEDLNVTSNYFNATKCVLLMACEGARGMPNSFANILHNKGVQSVVAFREEIIYGYDGDTGVIDPNYGHKLFTQRFLNRLGQGFTVNAAASLTNDEELKDNFGLGSCEIIGHGTLVVKN